MYMEERIEQFLTHRYIHKADGTLTDLPEYHSVDPRAYDKKLCVIPDEVIAFLQESQPDTYKELIENAGGVYLQRKRVRFFSEKGSGPQDGSKVIKKFKDHCL